MMEHNPNTGGMLIPYYHEKPVEIYRGLRLAGVSTGDLPATNNTLSAIDARLGFPCDYILALATLYDVNDSLGSGNDVYVTITDGSGEEFVVYSVGYGDTTITFPVKLDASGRIGVTVYAPSWAPGAPDFGVLIRRLAILDAVKFQ